MSMTGSEGLSYCNVRIDDKRCNYCMECVESCSTGALTYDKCFEHDMELCSFCEVCMDVCSEEAIKILEM